MEERYLGKIEPDVDVCDINGDKVGSVARVYRHEMATSGAIDRPVGMPSREELVEVKTGFLGLGRMLYVPMGAIQDVTQGCVFLSRSKDEFDSLGWAEKPTYLDELH